MAAPSRRANAEDHLQVVQYGVSPEQADALDPPLVFDGVSVAGPTASSKLNSGLASNSSTVFSTSGLSKVAQARTQPDRHCR